MKFAGQILSMLKTISLVVSGLFFFQHLAHAEVPEIEREALVVLYDSTNGAEWERSTRWLEGDPCTNNWWGKVCNQDGNISHLTLLSNNLSGVLPPELGNLERLWYLWLESNRLRGPIPPELGGLSNLAYLRLDRNELNGSIPTELGNLVNLRVLSLSDNQLSGSMSPELGMVTKLEQLLLERNQLGGSIPGELSQLVKLRTLLMSSNALTGEIPIELSNLTSLSEGKVDLRWNGLYTSDAAFDAFLDTKSEHDWSMTQTVAPENVAITQTSEHEATLTWDAIEYQGDIGRYRVSYSTAAGGPYTSIGTSTDKTATGLSVGGLPANSTLYFVVQTETDDHIRNTNKVVSDVSPELMGLTPVAPPGFFITPVSGLFTSEAGATDTFEVSLDVQPFSDVTLPLSSSDVSEGSISHDSLTFTNSDWNVPQVVTVTGVDDDEADGHQQYMIITGVATSIDIAYDGIDPTDISVKNEDDGDVTTAALEAFYNSTGGPLWNVNTHWLLGDPCEDNWYGVTCDSNANIIGLDLYMNNLVGVIPPEIGGLVSLRKLELYRNHQLGGSIPAELGNLASLNTLNLGATQVSGPIPAEFSKLINLQTLSLGGNLAGSFPTILLELINLRHLDLSGAQLSGPIPAELGDLTNLVSLDLSYNELSGAIPPELGNLTGLTSLNLQYNRLRALIPSELGNLFNLTHLRLSHNLLWGPIPPELGNLINLGWLSLGWNKLSGSIPPELGNLTKLGGLFLERNQLSGSIPPELGNIVGNLNWLYLESNKLSGMIPTELTRRESQVGLESAIGQVDRKYPSNSSDSQTTPKLAWERFPPPWELGWNALYSAGAAQRSFLNEKTYGKWNAGSSQTVAPKNIVVSRVGTDSVRITWRPILYTWNEGGYRVWYGTSPDGPYVDGGITIDKTTTSHTITGLEKGQSYYFVVTTETKPHHRNTNLVISEQSPEIILPATPGKPTGIKATDGTYLGLVRVTFDLVEDATVYRVFRCLDMGQTCGSPIGYTTSGVFNDRNAVPGTVYYYRVRACVKNDCGKFSAANTGFASIPPPQPTGVTASDGSFPDRVEISWNAVEGVSVYRVFRCLDKGQTCGSPIGFPNGTGFDDRKGDPGTVYYYRVKACNTQHCSKFSVANAGSRSDTPALEQDKTNAILLPGQQVPIPTLSDWGRWLLTLMVLGFGLLLLNRQYARNSG